MSVAEDFAPLKAEIDKAETAVEAAVDARPADIQAKVFDLLGI